MAFAFVAEDLGPRDLDVVQFTGVEAVSEPFVYSIRVVTEMPFEAVERAVFARPAALHLGGTREEPRAVTGIVRSLEAAGVVRTPEGSRNAVRVELVPRFALLRERQRSRIFQDLDTASIVRNILDEWGIAHRFVLTEEHASWPYCVQHDETDLAFVSRILAADGIHYTFQFAPAGEAAVLGERGSEVILFGDSPVATERPVPPPHLPLVPSSALEGSEESIQRFARRRTIAPSSIRVRSYNPDNARYDAQGKLPAPRPDLNGRAELAIYHYSPERPLGAESESALRRTLGQLRGRADVAEGDSNCRRLGAGERFVFGDIAERTTYITTRVRSKGRTAWYQVGDDPLFECSFEAVPASSSIAPPLPARRRHAGLDTAVVVGPHGVETHTDGMGRIKVQFRWDLDRAADDESSCWIRVAQSWAGPGFGSQFLPRVGMEVLVGYLDGDINRPVVVGCVPNSSNPSAFRLPDGHAKSGFITRSSPEGEGYNELSFDDTRSREKITLRAERDLDVGAQRNHARRSGRDDNVNVGRDATLDVARDRSVTVRQNERTEVGGTQWTSVGGDRVVRVAGQAIEQLTGGRTLDVGGDSRAFVSGNRQESVGGRLDATVEDDVVARLRGSAATIVGAPDAKRSWLLHVDGALSEESSGALRIASDAQITLSCGDTELVLTPDGIHLKASTIVLEGGDVKAKGDTFTAVTEKLAKLSSKKVQLSSSDGASVRLTADAKVDGSTVKLGSASDSDSNDDDSTTSTPTTIKLRDQDGKPIPGERYVLVASDGTRTSGVLDEYGEATLVGLTGQVEVRFPELGDWSAMPSASASPEAVARRASTNEALGYAVDDVPALDAIGPGQDGYPDGGG